VKRKQVLVIGAVCALVSAVVLIASLNGPKEPEYQGKKLSEWIAMPIKSGSTPGTSGVVGDAEMAGAIRAIGTNGLPFLVRWVEYETPVWKLNLAKYIPPGGTDHLTSRLVWRQETRADQALYGFLYLGKQGTAAMPTLGRYLEQHGEQGAGPRVLEALKVASGSRADISGAVPGILIAEERLQNRIRVFDGPSYVRDFISGEGFVAGLTNALRHTNAIVRRRAVGTLVQFHEIGKDETVMLRAAFGDPDPEVRKIAEDVVVRLERHKRPVE
jgi:hypothetical protein